MAQPRKIDPITRTYLEIARSKAGRTKIHARIYSPDYDLDRRATHATPAGAVRKILAMLPAPAPRRERKRQ